MSGTLMVGSRDGGDTQSGVQGEGDTQSGVQRWGDTQSGVQRLGGDMECGSGMSGTLRVGFNDEGDTQSGVQRWGDTQIGVQSSWWVLAAPTPHTWRSRGAALSALHPPRVSLSPRVWDLPQFPGFEPFRRHSRVTKPSGNCGRAPGAGTEGDSGLWGGLWGAHTSPAGFLGCPRVLREGIRNLGGHRVGLHGAAAQQQQHFLGCQGLMGWIMGWDG